MALLVVLFGGIITLGLDQFWIIHWSKSGAHFPVGERQSITLPAGQSLVYYESPHSIPTGRATLNLYDAQEVHSRLPLFTDRDYSFRIRFTGLSGRAMWQLNINEPGEYRFSVSNEDVLRDEDIPPEDQIVFFKTPSTPDDAILIQKIIRFTGFGITAVLFIICYLIHYATLAKTDADEPEQFEGEFELEP